MNPAVSHPAPLLFLVDSGVVAVALAWHAIATYGRQRGVRLLLALGAAAVVHEWMWVGHSYEVHVPGPRPFGIPVGISVGWVVTALLGIDFARRVSWLIRPAWAGRLVPMVLLTASFAAGLSNAIEPVGQVMGWWSWNARAARGEFPHLAPGLWFINVYMMAAVALVAAGLARRRLEALVVVMSPFLPIFVPLPPPLLAVAVGIAVARVWRARGVRVHAGLAPAVGVDDPSLIELVPLGATLLILLTLAVYASRSPTPEVMRHAGAVALLGTAPYVVLGVRRLRSALWRAHPAKPASNVVNRAQLSG